MKAFPWLTLFYLLLAALLFWSVVWLLRKRIAKWICKRALTQGKRDQVNGFILQARSDGLIQPAEEADWRKEFGLEAECKQLS
jgi:hypothetical protein